MPTVPQQVGSDVPDSELQPPQISRYAYMAIGSGGEELQRAGETTAALGAETDAMANQTLMLANQTRVNDAMNQLRGAQQNLTYGDPNDPSTGYLSQQGKNALERPNGQSLTGEYMGKLQEASDTISGTLSNPAQQQMFQRQAAGVMTGFQGDLEKHTLQQFHSYALSTQDGTIKLAQNAAGLSWNNPDTVATSVQQAQAAAIQSGRLMGLAPTQIEANRQDVVSGIHTKVIESALENNAPGYAMGYMNANRSSMTADDILRVQGQLNRDVDSQVSTMAVTATTAQYQPALQPTSLDRFQNLVLNQESGGRGDFNPDGSPLTSSKGAKYAMQVTDATAANPGFGVKPAQDDTPAEYNRVGQQLLQTYVKKYGNVAQASAAYNAGSGAVDTAISEAQKAGDANWLGRLPAETQNYVSSVTSQYNAGEGAPPAPTKEDFVNAAIQHLGPNPRPEQIQLTQAAAERQYGVLQSSIKDQGEQALNNVQRALIANGGDFNNVDQGLKEQLAQTDPENYAKAQTFAKSISKGDNETNPAAYAALATYPKEMAKLSDAQWLQLGKTQLSSADFDHFTNERANILNGKTDTSAGSINAPALNTALNERLTNIGINAKPDKGDTDGLTRLGEIQKFVRDDVFSQQQQLGRKMTPQEISERVYTIFAKDATFKNTFLGFSTGGTSSKPIMGLSYGDVPDDIRGYIDQKMPNATEGDKLRTYWTWQMQQNAGQGQTRGR